MGGKQQSREQTRGDKWGKNCEVELDISASFLSHAVLPQHVCEWQGRAYPHSEPPLNLLLELLVNMGVL